MISEEDKNRARKHLGYGQVQQSSTFVLGVPAGVQTAFMIEGSWSRILPSAERQFRQVLDQLDAIECQFMGDMGNLATESVGNVKMNLKEMPMLMDQHYAYWCGVLSNMLQVPRNPFDARLGAGAVLNVPVSH